MTTSIEHPAVTEVVNYLTDAEGFEASFVDVASDGVTDVGKILSLVRDDTILISVSE